MRPRGGTQKERKYFASRVKALMADNRLTNPALAKAMRLTEREIIRYRTAKYVPDLGRLRKLADILGTTVEDLTGDEADVKTRLDAIEKRLRKLERR